jgi:hypothetical protein
VRHRLEYALDGSGCVSWLTGCEEAAVKKRHRKRDDDRRREEPAHQAPGHDERAAASSRQVLRIVFEYFQRLELVLRVIRSTGFDVGGRAGGDELLKRG